MDIDRNVTNFTFGKLDSLMLLMIIRAWYERWMKDNWLNKLRVLGVNQTFGVYIRFEAKVELLFTTIR